jgi:hypothetical protein
VLWKTVATVTFYELKNIQEFQEFIIILKSSFTPLAFLSSRVEAWIKEQSHCNPFMPQKATKMGTQCLGV